MAGQPTLQNLRTPPILAGEESYLEWLEDLKVWVLFTDLDKKKQGPAVYLTLTGNARDCVRDLTPEQLGSDDGVDKIIKKLDKVYRKDKDTQTFVAFESFYNYRRAAGVNITEFLVEFGYLCTKLTKQNIVLPQGVLAFLLLKASNISTEHERLARATCASMTYENMKTCILKIFGGPSSEGGEGSVPSIKSEPVFQTTHEDALQNNWRNNWRSRGRGARNRGRGFNTSSFKDGDNKSNPCGKDGKVLRCFKCGSPSHFARNCDQDSGSGTQDIHIVLLNALPALSSLVAESLGMGLLDSACTRTVTGQAWFDAFCDSLSDSDRALVKSYKVSTKFKFGDGKEVDSCEEVVFPVVIGTKKVKIKASVVDNEIPLLLSKASMKRARLVLNFQTDTARILGQKVRLHCTSSGHYCLPLSNTILYDGRGVTSFVLHTEGFSSLTDDEKYKKAMKLHRQFAHASKERLCKLVRDSSTFNDAGF